jgi:Ca-activated chloride channel family protein
MMTEFHFIRPYGLLALIPCLLFIILLCKQRLPHGNWENICDKALLPYLLQQQSTKQNKIVFISTAIATVLAILAIAGPTWQRLPVPVFRNDSGLVIALDLSRSMLASDIKPSRLIRARYKIADILTQRKEGQTALIVYAGDAFTVTPLTTDNATIIGQLNALTPDIIPSSGANTVLALQQAVDLFKQAGLQTGHILLVTDGVNLTKSLALVKKLGRYSVSILAVGTENGAPIKLPQGGFLKDPQGNIIVAKLVLNELQQLASAGQGILAILSDDNSDVNALLNVVDQFAQLVNNQQPEEDLLLDQWNDQGFWLLLVIIPLMAMNFRRGILLALLFILPFPQNSYAFEWQDLWETKNQQAEKLYQQRQFSQAAETFEDVNWKATAYYKAGQYDKVGDTLKNEKTADSFYNQGNALAKTGQFAEAIKRYDQALKLNVNDDDTQYNKKLVEKQLKKQQQANKSDDNQQGKNNKSTNSTGDKPKKTSKKSKDNQQHDNQNGENKAPQATPDEKKNNDEAQQAKPDTPLDNNKSAQPSVTQQAQLDEGKQADAQWLNRIADDPGGLLRRKFAYQYKLRRGDDKETQAW